MTTIESVIHHDAVDAAWMTEILRRTGRLGDEQRVTAIEYGPCGTGQLADSFRFTMIYDPPGVGPATLVGKFASDDPISRDFGRSSHQYRTEIRFYQELAPVLTSVAVPTALHAALADNETDFVLLMEDLDPALKVDQLVGCSGDQAALVVRQAAALHAGSWRDPALAATEWLGSTIAGWRQITDGFDVTVGTFRENYPNYVGDEHLEQAARLLPHRSTWKRILSEPRSLWHNDLRADNVMYDAHGGSLPVVMHDWQGVTYARGMMDVAYFIATSMTTEDRRTHERDLVREYHQALTAHGVDELSEEDCWREYRLLAIHPLQTGVFGVGAVKRSERGDRMWRSWIERSSVMTSDLDSFSVLAGW